MCVVDDFKKVGDKEKMGVLREEETLTHFVYSNSSAFLFDLEYNLIVRYSFFSLLHVSTFLNDWAVVTCVCFFLFKERLVGR
jgi:hypothetical protein